MSCSCVARWPADCDRLHVAAPQTDATSRRPRERKDFLEVHQRIRIIVISVLSTGSYFKGQSAPHTPMLDLEGKFYGDDEGKDETTPFSTLLIAACKTRLLKDVREVS